MIKKLNWFIFKPTTVSKSSQRGVYTYKYSEISGANESDCAVKSRPTDDQHCTLRLGQWLSWVALQFDTHMRKLQWSFSVTQTATIIMNQHDVRNWNWLARFLPRAFAQINVLVTTRTLGLHATTYMHVSHAQWPSQALKSGWAQGVWAPSGVQGRSPDGGLGAKPPEARYIQTICSCQMLFYAGLLPSPSSIFLYPLPPKKTSDLCESHDPTQPVQNRHMHVPTRAYPWLQCWSCLVSSNVFYSCSQCV